MVLEGDWLEPKDGDEEGLGDTVGVKDLVNDGDGDSDMEGVPVPDIDSELWHHANRRVSASGNGWGCG